MASRSANVVARVEPEIKQKAEGILAKLGISESTGINMFYREIILYNGLPFRPYIPSAPESLDEMTKSDFDTKMTRALEQSERGEGMPSDKFFDSLRREIKNNA